MVERMKKLLLSKWKTRKLNVVVLGSDGMLGYDVHKHLIELAAKKDSEIGIVSGIDVNDHVDVTSKDALLSWFEGKIHYDVCINCIAYTNTSAAETTREGRAASYKLNALAVEKIARVCRELKMKLIHISTDYVFSEMGYSNPSTTDIIPFKPTDDEFPCNNYGEHKLIGELLIRTTLPTKEYCILRTSWLYGAHNNKSFVHKFMRNVVKAIRDGKTEVQMNNFEISRPTCTTDLVDAICKVIETKEYGILHAVSRSNDIPVTRVEFAKEILQTFIDMHEHGYGLDADLINKIQKIKVVPVYSETYQPRFSAMRTSYIFDMPKWNVSLSNFITLHAAEILEWAKAQQ